MLNEERIRQMTALALYEKGEGKEEMKISRYFKGDYIGLKLLKNFFATTLGFVLILGMWAMWKLEWLLGGMDSMNLITFFGIWIAIYLLMLAVYSAVTVWRAYRTHDKAVRNVKKYSQGLSALLKEYAQEEKNKRPDKNRQSDKGRQTDKGSSTNKSRQPDKGRQADKGSPADKSRQPDKGRQADKGSPADKSRQPDKGRQADKGSPANKSRQPDKGRQSDKGSPANKSRQPDKSRQTDKGRQPDKGRQSETSRKHEENKESGKKQKTGDRRNFL